ncbi:MAG: D-alanyl-D-alanine carboxypeptidase [Micavibrio aeruginosavorus]|nr:D-alanyl-D-alanine carboxypeptidase [Micavibrio aeruginosavorus]
MSTATRVLNLKTGIIAKSLALLALLAALVASPADAATKKRNSANTPNPRYASIVVDADTGAVLSESSADKQLHPASLVKMMTLLMTFEALERGKLTLSSRVRMSSHAAAQAPSKLGIPAGGSLTVRDAIYALVTKSANDVATALGETVGGSESRFVAMMNQRAQEIGMTRTTFRNASGLHNPGQVSTARDFAILSRHLIKNYPDEYKYFSKRNFSYNGVSHHNHNRLMETYRGMDGIKTGFIQPSGFNLAASAVRGNHRVIAVVFGGRTAQSRNAHVASLLDQGFAKLGAGGDVRIASLPKLQDKAPAPVQVALAPLPGRKPARRDMLQQPTAQQAPAQQIAAATPKPVMGQELIGEGDFDPAVARRFETGMMAIAALRGELLEPASGGNTAAAPAPAAAVTPTPASFTPAQKNSTASDWAVQIGAYTSRVRSDQVLSEAIGKLPLPLKTAARPVIVPMKAGNGWVFRARLRGLSREQATAACRYFTHCMTISPRSL